MTTVVRPGRLLTVALAGLLVLGVAMPASASTSDRVGTATLVGQLVERRSGWPIPGAVITLTPITASTASTAASDAPVRRAVTDLFGRFTFTNVVPGDYGETTNIPWAASYWPVYEDTTNYTWDDPTGESRGAHYHAVPGVQHVLISVCRPRGC